MIKLNVSAANIAVEEKETLTEGRVGLLCQFRFTEEWTGLAKTAVFDGADSRDVILKSDTVAIPAECLSAEGYSLSVGVYGKNSAGDIVIPTVYATVGKIQRSAYPSGKETAEPTPDVVAQIQQAAANAEELARSVREDADLGKFQGAAGQKGDKGDKGDKGNTGATGAQGPAGATGPAGKDGKSAYAYAVEGGYTKTEAEFAEKLAQEQLTGTTNGLTPTQVYEAVSAGIPVKVQHTNSIYGILSFTAFNVAESLNAIVSQTIVYYNSVYILAELFGNKSNNTWGFMTTALAQKADIPTALPNPAALKFTGAVTGIYNGTKSVSIEIPSAVTDDHINSLIDTKLGVIENGSY